MSKTAQTATPIMDEIAMRWSPRALSSDAIDDEIITQIFEAARWAASTYNEQPWRYVIAHHADTANFNTLLGCLVEANQAWAQSAAVIGIGFAQTTFSRNGNEYAHAWHDLGLANAQLSIQAQHAGIYTHFMAGIEDENIPEKLNMPENLVPVVGFAMGRLGDPSNLPDWALEAENAPRERKPLEAILFQNEF